MDVLECWCSRFYGIENDSKMFFDDFLFISFIWVIFDFKYIVC